MRPAPISVYRALTDTSTRASSLEQQLVACECYARRHGLALVQVFKEEAQQ